MDWTTVVSTIITALGDVGPVTYFAILVTGALGFVWFMDRRASEAALKALRDEFSAMVAQKDARYDARELAYGEREAAYVAAISAAQAQVATVVKDHSDANKDTSEVLSTVGRTMNELATTVKDILQKDRHDRH